MKPSKLVLALLAVAALSSQAAVQDFQFKSTAFMNNGGFSSYAMQVESLEQGRIRTIADKKTSEEAQAKAELNNTPEARVQQQLIGMAITAKINSAFPSYGQSGLVVTQTCKNKILNGGASLVNGYTISSTDGGQSYTYSMTPIGGGGTVTLSVPGSTVNVANGYQVGTNQNEVKITGTGDWSATNPTGNGIPVGTTKTMVNQAGTGTGVDC